MKYIKLYGIVGFARLVISKALTMLFYSNSRLIRFPFECRGRYLIDFGKGLSTGRYCRIEAYGNGVDKKIIFGNNCQINDSVHIVAANKIKIGDDVLIASRVFISDLNHGSYSGAEHSHPYSLCRERELYTKDVVIESNVWLGEGVVVLSGVKIGESSIIGANAVVCRDVPAYSIAVGNPARVIKKYDFQNEQWVGVDEK